MFSSKTLSFLRALKRHNDREWFAAHRDDYERHVREPMRRLVERIAGDLPSFAPELVASPRVSIYRIYRDTRFSADKTPFKTHAAAIFPCRGLGKHEGAGLYLEVRPARVLAAGGMYRPQTAQLQRLREHLAANYTQFRSLVEAPSFRKRVGTIDGEKLKRVPRGFPVDHPAAEYLKFRQFLAWREFPASLASSPRFYRSVLGVFRQLAPMIRFLNAPLLGA